MCLREERKRKNKTLVVFVTVTTQKTIRETKCRDRVINEMVNRETVFLRLHCIAGWRSIAKQERE